MKTPDIKTILFIYKDLTHFVNKDLVFLRDNYEVSEHISPFKNNLFSFVKELLRQFLFLILRAPGSDVIFIWFADYHSFLPVLFARIFRKKAYLVWGGYDVMNIPEFKYGSFSKPFRAYCTRYSISHATLNLPVTEALVEEAKKHVVSFRHKVLPTGYDPKLYSGRNTREKLVITTSITDNMQRYKIKGIDRFVELAAIMPDYQFVIIGMQPGTERYIENPSSNLRWELPMEHKTLAGYYERAMFYAQFSRSEGMPNAVCEAMLAGCIPVGLNVGGIADTIGDAGIVVPSWDSERIRDLILENLDNQKLSEAARKRISDHFSVERRENELRSIIA